MKLVGDKTWPETVIVEGRSGMKILSPGSRSTSLSGNFSNMSKSNSVTTLPIGSIFSKSVINLEIDVNANVGSPPTEDILPLEIAVAIDCSS